MAAPATPQNGDRARVALVVLSGDPNEARARLAELRPNADVVEIEKSRFDPRRIAQAGALRRERFDEAAFFTLARRWQRRRAPLFATAVLAGAGRVLLFDAAGDWEEFARGRVLFREIPRTVAEILLLPLLYLFDRIASTALALVWRVRPPGQTLERRDEDEPLRWLYLRQTPASAALEGGASAHFRGALEGFAELGHRVHVLANDELPTAIPSPLRTSEVTPPTTWFNVSLLGYERWANWVWLWRAWRAIGRVRPDAVYHRNARSAWASVAAAWLRGVPVVLEYNVPETLAGAYWNNLRRLGGVRRAEALTLGGATTIGAVSDACAALAVEAGARPERVFVNANGVNVDRFATPEAAREAETVRAELGLEGKIVAGFVGTFIPFHGVDVLVEAIELLASDDQIHVLFVGDGGGRPGAERALDAHVRAGRVTFTGRVRFERLPAYLAAIDVCLAPYVSIPQGSAFINSPIKLFEYMAAGRAIVASELGQIREILADGAAGALVPERDPRALADAIRGLANDAGSRERLGRAARERAESHYTWRANAARAAASLRRVS